MSSIKNMISKLDYKGNVIKKECDDIDRGISDLKDMIDSLQKIMVIKGIIKDEKCSLKQQKA